MIVVRLKLPLEQAEYTALLKIAGDELRNPMDQVRFILRQELERRGVLRAKFSSLTAISIDDPKQEDRE